MSPREDDTPTIEPTDPSALQMLEAERAILMCDHHDANKVQG
jgi:hypothetical protein